MGGSCDHPNRSVAPPVPLGLLCRHLLAIVALLAVVLVSKSLARAAAGFVVRLYAHLPSGRRGCRRLRLRDTPSCGSGGPFSSVFGANSFAGRCLGRGVALGPIPASTSSFFGWFFECNAVRFFACRRGSVSGCCGAVVMGVRRSRRVFSCADFAGIFLVTACRHITTHTPSTAPCLQVLATFWLCARACNALSQTRRLKQPRRVRFL